MALGMPELRRVRPEKYLKFGPDLSSSHWRQSLREPSGLLLASPLHQDQRHFSKHLLTKRVLAQDSIGKKNSSWTDFDLVLSMFHAQMVAHSCEKPSIFRQLISAEVESQPRAPHILVGTVRLRFMYVPKSFRKRKS